MIEKSFIFLDGINYKKESNIWAQKIYSWDDFISRDKIKGISYFMKRHYDRLLIKAKKSLFLRDTSFFKDILPSMDTWRLYERFKNECLFLDIEAGTRKRVEVIGLYDGESVVTLHKDYNLEKFFHSNFFNDFKLLITFNGSVFDLPIINEKLGCILPNIPHIDLRFLCDKIGLKGGLKKIEKKLELERDVFFENRNKSLYNIISYNQSDVLNLKPILEYCIKLQKNSSHFSILRS